MRIVITGYERVTGRRRLEAEQTDSEAFVEKHTGEREVDTVMIPLFLKTLGCQSTRGLRATKLLMMRRARHWHGC